MNMGCINRKINYAFCDDLVNAVVVYAFKSILIIHFDVARRHETSYASSIVVITKLIQSIVLRSIDSDQPSINDIRFLLTSGRTKTIPTRTICFECYEIIRFLYIGQQQNSKPRNKSSALIDDFKELLSYISTMFKRQIYYYVRAHPMKSNVNIMYIVSETANRRFLRSNAGRHHGVRSSCMCQHILNIFRRINDLLKHER